jgi:hypothetical protein
LDKKRNVLLVFYEGQKDVEEVETTEDSIVRPLSGTNLMKDDQSQLLNFSSRIELSSVEQSRVE